MSDKPRSRFSVALKPYFKLKRDLEDGLASRIEPKEIACEIRKHGIEKMPEEVVSFLCDHLDGRIDRRGRKGLTPVEKQLAARRAALYYVSIRAALKARSSTVPELLAFLDENALSLPEGAAASEKAWRLTSILVSGHQGEYKSLANLVSKHAPLTPKRAS